LIREHFEDKLNHILDWWKDGFPSEEDLDEEDIQVITIIAMNFENTEKALKN
jgi:hypothetical protein